MGLLPMVGYKNEPRMRFNHYGRCYQNVLEEEEADLNSIHNHLPTSACDIVTTQKQRPKKLSRSYFSLGTFQANSFTIRLHFDQIKGFKALLSNNKHLLQNVELLAPFSHLRNIPREKLKKLSKRLYIDYDIRVTRTGEQFKVEFHPKLPGGGQMLSVMGLGYFYYRRVYEEKEVKQRPSALRKSESSSRKEVNEEKDNKDQLTTFLLFQEQLRGKTHLSEKEINVYLKKYLDLHPSATWSLQKYRKEMAKMQGLPPLITSPFLLYVAAEVLPDLVENNEDKKEICSRDLYDAFIDRWFSKAECKLILEGKLVNYQGDVKVRFANYCKKLASKMFTEGLTSVVYQPMEEGERKGDWDSFFSDEGLIGMARSGAPLKKVGEDRYAFIDSSIQDYFVFRDSFDHLLESSAKAEMPQSKEERFEPFLVLEHPEEVNSVAISFDNKWLASTSGFDIHLWNMELGKSLKILEGHSSIVKSCLFLPNDKKLVSASWDHTIKLWDPLTGKTLSTLEGHTDSVEVCTCSKDGKWLASASWDQTILLWDLQTEKPLHCFKGHTDTVRDCAFSNDSRWLVSIGDDKKLIIWDVKEGRAMHILQRHSANLTSCSISPDNKSVVSTSKNGIKIWDIVTGKLLKAFEGGEYYLNSGCFSRNGKRLVSTSTDGTIRSWDLESGHNSIVSDKHSDSVNSAAFSSNGKWLASAGKDKKVILFKVST